MSKLTFPPEIEFNDYQQWNPYEEACYNAFVNDFVFCRKKPVINNWPVNIRRHPEVHGRVRAFYHLISDDFTGQKLDEDRVPDIERAGKITWVRFCIENYDHREFINWKNKRNGRISFLIYHKEKRFLVILSERSDYYVLITCYPITRSHKHGLLMKEYTNYWKNPY